MRWKFEREDLEMYKCCFCCHVRTGTLLLGIINLLGHILGLTLFIVAMVHPELVQDLLPEKQVLPPVDNSVNTGFMKGTGNSYLKEVDGRFTKGNDAVVKGPKSDNIGMLKISGNNIDNYLGNEHDHRNIVSNEMNIALDNNFNYMFENKSNVIYSSVLSRENLEAWMDASNWSVESMIAAILLTLASMAIAICLLYGTIRGVSKYITPFFCVQMFDLCLSGLTMLGYFSDVPSIRKWISAQDALPFKQQLLALDNDHLTLLTLIIFVGILSIKAYFIGVVWTCYKYLKLHETNTAAGSQARMRIYDNDELVRCPEDAQMLLPPKYEDVLLMPGPEAVPPPPAYSRQ